MAKSSSVRSDRRLDPTEKILRPFAALVLMSLGVTRLECAKYPDASNMGGGRSATEDPAVGPTGAVERDDSMPLGAGGAWSVGTAGRAASSGRASAGSGGYVAPAMGGSAAGRSADGSAGVSRAAVADSGVKGTVTAGLSEDSSDANQAPANAAGAGDANAARTADAGASTDRALWSDWGVSAAPDAGPSIHEDGSDSGAPARRTSGCGVASSLTSGTHTIGVQETARSYDIDLPSNYDPTHPYRAIFAFHWPGGSADDLALVGYYGLKSLANDTAILIAPDGMTESFLGISGKSWSNTGDRDVAFVRAVLDYVSANLCIDRGRIFATGFSVGAMMTNAVACEMADVFRAVAPMSGSFGSGCVAGNDHPIAFWGAHGRTDGLVGVGLGREARDYFVARDHCSSRTVPAALPECFKYESCSPGYPVVWCEFSGGHRPWHDAARSLWDFLSQF